MNSLAAISFGLAGALAGVPVAAIAYAVPAHGSVRLPERWWRGAPASPVAVAATSFLAGAAAALVGGVLPWSPAVLAFGAFAVLGVGIAIIDVRVHRLPHTVTGVLWASCILCFTVTVATSGNAHPLIRAFAAGSGATAVLLIVALALPGQLGLGDVVLTGAIGLSLGWLSWQAAVLGVLGGLVLQSAVALLALALGRRRNSRLPMGPALVAGWMLAVAASGFGIIARS